MRHADKQTMIAQRTERAGKSARDERKDNLSMNESSVGADSDKRRRSGGKSGRKQTRV